MIFPYVYHTPRLESDLQLTEKPAGLFLASQLLTLCGRRNAWHVRSHFFHTSSRGVAPYGWPGRRGLPLGAQSTLGWLIKDFGEVNPGFHIRVVRCGAIRVTFTAKQRQEKMHVVLCEWRKMQHKEMDLTWVFSA